MSAFLRAKNVPHRLMPPDAVQPGKFNAELAGSPAFVCLCWLTAPSEARFAYIEKRIAARLPEARMLGIAWRNGEGARSMLSPEHALSMLPSHAPEKATEAPHSSPEPSTATH